MVMILHSASLFKSNSEDETYPAFKRSKFDDMVDIIESTNGRKICYNGWRLPSTEPKKEDCGRWGLKACLNVEGHRRSEFKDKIFLKSFQKCCFKASCEVCVKKWAGRDASRATMRIEKYVKLTKKPPKHIILSAPSWKYDLDHKSMKKEVYRIAKKVGVVGGAMIFHPFRLNKKIREWYYSPHFHIVGFGWIARAEGIYNKEGWIVKNKGLRNSVFGTFHYLLSHCGVKEGRHSQVWFGKLSYSNLKLEKEPENGLCPVCGVKLKPVYYCGLLGAPPPQGEFEMWVEPEGWHLLENKSRVVNSTPKEVLIENRVARELYDANKGVKMS